MKKCPYCAEGIQDESIKCRFCGEWLKQNTMENPKDMASIRKETLSPRSISTNKNPEKAGFVSFLIGLFKGRLERLDYFLFILVCLVFIWIFAGIISAMTSSSENGVLYKFFLLIFLIMDICVCLLGISGHIRRLHDSGKSGFWFLIVCVPFIGLIWFIVLILTKGTEDVNKYGAMNNQNGFFKRVFNLN